MIATIGLRFDGGQLAVLAVGLLLVVLTFVLLLVGIQTGEEREAHGDRSGAAVAGMFVLVFAGLFVVVGTLMAYDREQHVRTRAELRDRGYEIVHLDTRRQDRVTIRVGRCEFKNLRIEHGIPTLGGDTDVRLTLRRVRELARTETCREGR